MSETGHNGSNSGARGLRHEPHDEFRELCALRTTGELSAEESSRLHAHLEGCAACRKLSEEYDQLIATVIPALAAEFEPGSAGEDASDTWSIEEAERALMHSLKDEPELPHRFSNRRSGLSLSNKRWKYLLAAGLFGAFSLACYQAGWIEARRSLPGRVPETATNVRSAPKPNPPPVISSTRAEASSAKESPIVRPDRNLREKEDRSSNLRNQLARLDGELERRNADLEQSRAQQAELRRELEQAQSDARAGQAKLDAIGNQSSEDTAALLADKTKISDLNGALADKEKRVAQDEELLARDRDIRNLIGARNLYIAEIYDVGKFGDTQKPFGRVFYTKDRSLIFYGYDLDQQRGLRKDATFQAWGRRGADGANDVSLGLLYQDDSAKKRWVLKFNDSKTIAQLDAVFITAEPEGGSSKPTGKPLLFTYLRLDPNHP